MLDFIENWIDEVNLAHKSVRRSCSVFQESFKGFYTPEFLRLSYFVIVERLPKPDYPELRNAGLGDFIDMEFAGITYKNTYYILPHAANELRLHFHELVHVLQWRELSAKGFIQRYIEEMQTFGYGNDAPLEKMAYHVDGLFEDGAAPFDVENYVLRNL